MCLSAFIRHWPGKRILLQFTSVWCHRVIEKHVEWKESMNKKCKQVGAADGPAPCWDQHPPDPAEEGLLLHAVRWRWLWNRGGKIAVNSKATRCGRMLIKGLWHPPATGDWFIPSKNINPGVQLCIQMNLNRVEDYLVKIFPGTQRAVRLREKTWKGLLSSAPSCLAFLLCFSVIDSSACSTLSG